MAHKRHRQPLEIMSQINVTNLLDTAFILLITFMLVAPHLNSGLKIDLPTVTKPVSLPTDPAKTILITVEKRTNAQTGSRISLKNVGKNTERMDPTKLQEEMNAAKAANKDVQVVIEGDVGAPYGDFFGVIDIVRQAGIDNIGLSSKGTEPDNKPDSPDAPLTAEASK